ncbi:hypothetical protein [Nocardioides aurantiacus]|uniref:hypothetical protein n=1 Tax=Nocardioides aurantiacus TaxID=86796 RepID=UPI00403F4977
MSSLWPAAKSPYERLWWAAATPFCAVGLWVGCLVMPYTTLGLAIVAAIKGGFIHFVVTEPGLVTRPRTARLARVGTTAGLSAFWAGSFVGLVVVFDGLAFVLLALGLATAPWAVAAWRQWLGQRFGVTRSNIRQLVGDVRADGADEHALVSGASCVEELSDDQLCAAWRLTCSALESNPPTIVVTGIVRARAAYIEELSRRYPSAAAAWIMAGPAIGRDPAPFITHKHGQGRVVDWHQLIAEQGF